MFKKSAIKIDKDISFNVSSKLKSPKPVLRTSPRLDTLGQKNTNVMAKHTPGLSRKSVQFTSLVKPKVVTKPITRLNQTLVDLR